MQTPTPWLSVVIPAYRGEKWIATALDSLAEQAIDGVEILLVDGGPSTATVDIARTYADRLRLRIFERRDLSSWHTKTNLAVQMAEAAHICWLGVDDVWLPGRVEAVRRWIEDAPSVALHLAASVLIDHGGRVLGRWRCPLPCNVELASPFVLKRLLVQNFVAAPAPVFRRDAWLRCGGLDEQLWYTADWDIWLKLVATGPVLYHDAATIGFRVHSGALTVTGSRDAAEFKRQMLSVLERHLTPLIADSQSMVRTAHASIEVNLALAAAAGGDWRGLPRAAWTILKLGPCGISRYLRDSRVWERTLPRVRAKMLGSF
jgi:glycosyltransferase involved in cell wall biosynthesis